MILFNADDDKSEHFMYWEKWSLLFCLQAIPSEVRCESCHAKVLKVTEKMIKVMSEQTEPSDIDPTETGRNILNVISNYIPPSVDLTFSAIFHVQSEVALPSLQVAH